MEQDSAAPVSVEAELQRFPEAVLAEYVKAREVVARHFPFEQAEIWAHEGVAIALHSFRSWEAAVEYFKATPFVITRINSEELAAWARWGLTLSAASPVVSAAFFRATPEALDRVPADQLPAWATVGKELYRGTWKSSSFAATYFDTSPKLLDSLTLREVQELVGLLDTLAQRSYDLAADCLALSEGVFSRIDRLDRRIFLNLAAVLVATNWREVKPYFEHGGRSLVHVERSQRARFLALAEKLAKSSNVNIPTFLTDSGLALGEMEGLEHPELLGMAERLALVSPGSVVEFFRNVPQLSSRIKGEQLNSWFDEGLRILAENDDGGQAYFRLESGKGDKMIETLSNGLDLTRVQDILTMYSRALAGEEVDLQAAAALKEKNIGWNDAERPTTEGNTIYLPHYVDRYSNKDDNFAWYKVIATHQVAHLEFGSFNFDFERPAAIYQGREERAGRAVVDSKKAASDMQRYFNLFGDRKLANDIFTLLEDARIDFRVKHEYAGIRSAYQEVQQQALRNRPLPKDLPMREALMEVLVRMSLKSEESLEIPAEIGEHVRAIGRLMRSVENAAATVEDTAEATLRLYDIVINIPNVMAPPQPNEEMPLQQDKNEDKDEMEEQVNSLRGPGMQGQPGEEYDSPQEIDYRGEFKPELVQALTRLKEEQGKNGAESEGGQQMSAEELKQALEQSIEAAMSMSQEVMSDMTAAMVVDNMRQEAAKQKQQGGQGDAFPHMEETGDALTAKEPLTFVYDEWDFRANDYKPRWCRVRERGVEPGTHDFFEETLRSYAGQASKIKRQFEMLAPEQMHKVKHLPDGDEYDFDMVVESIIDKLSGDTPTDKVYWRRNKIQRDVAVAFLLDMSASTAEAVDDGGRGSDGKSFPDDPKEYMAWLRSRREEISRRPVKRIIDIEKESMVLLVTALEAIGDTYGIYGFSGYGRENVEFYVVKDMNEKFGESTKRRIDKISPMHATRMGPAIRHATSKLEKQDVRTKILFLLSDGRPQDRGYSREGVEKEYAVHDTRMALQEARQKHITPFCLTVDRAGHDYLKTMCADMGYEVVNDIMTLPQRLPQLYRRLTV